MTKQVEQKLLRKDVLKLIDNLTSGEYVKARQKLLVSGRDKKPDGFCCLGVWADQHGCVWKLTRGDYEPVKQAPSGKITKDNGGEIATLSGYWKLGLNDRDINELTRLNDNNDTWKEVLHYCVDELLPKAV